MRQHPMIEVLIVLAVVGLILEVAAAHTWVLIAAGVAAAIWLLSRGQ